MPSFILEHSFTAELKPPIIGEKWQTLNYSSMNSTAIIPGWTLSLDVCFWSVPGWHSASTFIFMIIQSKLWCNKLFKPVFLVKAMNQSAAGFFWVFSMYSDHLDLTCIVRPWLSSSLWSVINSSLYCSEVQWRMTEKSLPLFSSVIAQNSSAIIFCQCFTLKAFYISFEKEAIKPIQWYE